ncbi:hypothetical protein KYY02_32110 [Streptomyces pimonensis]|uniref:Uncharacterized protein n=1 Tax=Streptomyces pimonensis TaxID=2860288 RepID=A0ABV4J8D1_9ACTN
MSYDLAIWVGDAPSSDREAEKCHKRLYDEYLEDGEFSPVAAEIVDLISVLTDRWPDVDAGDDTPWASTPVRAGASGPYLYIGLGWESAERVSPLIAEEAHRLGLNCFDPQMRRLW